MTVQANQRIVNAEVAQRAASDPKSSVWVAASAGTGKTKVLTDRVLRLLVAGTLPGRILCLTFTKAAAAEMSNRLFERLAGWAAMEEGKLSAELTRLLGQTPTDYEVTRARRLFAGVLDAPEGLRIETLHGFAQSILRRFPVEAGVSPTFDVLDDRSAQDLLQRAREQVFQNAEPGSDLDRAIGAITDRVSDMKFPELIAAITGNRVKLSRMLRTWGGRTAAMAGISTHMGLSADASADSILSAACREGAGDFAGLRRLCQAMLDVGGKTDKDLGQIMANWLAASEAERARLWSDYTPAFLTAKGEMRSTSKLPCKKVKDLDPQFVEVYASEQERVLDVVETLQSVQVRDATGDLLTLAQAMLDAYDREKRRGGWLDYEDLIQKALGLLSRAEARPWVLYKLDGGLDHILVDEAQDTSADQWAVVDALTAEFFSGEGANPHQPRTVFAVGDIKQSIYRFQGAAPEKFTAQQEQVSRLAAEGLAQFAAVPLNTSFRSTQTVLDAVDAVFSMPMARDGVLLPDVTGQYSDDVLTRQRHIAAREDEPGLVEIWPRLTPSEASDPAPWNPPMERLRVDSAETRCAALVAKRIARMVGADGGAPEILASKGRPIRAGDIMILLRKRGGFQNDLIRSLKTYGVAVAGADRLMLSDHMAVQDCMALAEAALFPEDDLTLATVLKGPFLTWTEDQLFAVAHHRERGQSLWGRVQALASADDGGDLSQIAQTALQKIRHWGLHARALRPFAFFARLLEAEGGRATLRQRMGAEVDDPLNEILDLAQVYERGHAGSLPGFLHWFAADSNEIKRDMEQGSADLVRIMTVHGAKGLQAPVVFLPQTVSYANASGVQMEWATEAEKPVFMWKPPGVSLPAAMDAAAEVRKAEDERETRRLLYVAMTRAEDRLYVCGWDGKRSAPDGNWHDLIWHGVARLTQPLAAPELAEAFTAEVKGDAPEILRLCSGGRVATTTETEDAGAVPSMALPDWLMVRPPEDDEMGKPLMPSRPDEDDPAVPSPLAQGRDRFRRGNVMHRLLESLPDVPPAARRDVAERYLAQAVADWPQDVRQALAQEALDVLAIPEAQLLFGPQSQAEVPVSGLVALDAGQRLLSGQIDRLAITDTEILIADYKTNRPPPKTVDAVPDVYRKQLFSYKAALAAIFPDRVIRTFLLWTDGPNLMEISV